MTLSELPTDDEIAAEPDAIRRAILAAIQRLLTGYPKHARTGSDSVSQLAIEAGVGRHHLYQRNPDLRLRFERLRDTADRRTDEGTELQRRLDHARADVKRLTNLQAKTREQVEQWKGLVDLLRRAVDLLQEELRTEQHRSKRLESMLARGRESASNGGAAVPIRGRAGEGNAHL